MANSIYPDIDTVSIRDKAAFGLDPKEVAAWPDHMGDMLTQEEFKKIKNGAIWEAGVKDKLRTAFVASYDVATKQEQMYADLVAKAPGILDAIGMACKDADAECKAMKTEIKRTLNMAIEAAKEDTPGMFANIVRIGELVHASVFKKGVDIEGRRSIAKIVADTCGWDYTSRGGGSGGTDAGGQTGQGTSCSVGNDCLFKDAMRMLMVGEMIKGTSILKSLNLTLPLLALRDWGTTCNQSTCALALALGVRSYDAIEIYEKTYEIFIDQEVDINLPMSNLTGTKNMNIAQYYCYHDLLKYIHDVMNIRKLDKTSDDRVQEGYWMIKGMRLGMTFSTERSDVDEEPNEGYRFIMVNAHPEIQKAFQSFYPETQNRSPSKWWVLDRANMFASVNPLQKERVMVDYAQSFKSAHSFCMSSTAPFYFKRPYNSLHGTHPISGEEKSGSNGGEGLHCMFMTNSPIASSGVKARITGWVRVSPSPFFGEMLSKDIMDRYLLSRIPVQVSDKLSPTFGSQFQAERPKPTSMAGLLGLGVGKVPMTLAKAKKNTGFRKKSLAKKGHGVLSKKINMKDMLVMSALKGCQK